MKAEQRVIANIPIDKSHKNLLAGYSINAYVTEDEVIIHIPFALGHAPTSELWKEIVRRIK